MKIKSVYIYLSSLSIIFLCLILTTFFLFSSHLKSKSPAEKDSETIYVYLASPESDSESQTASFLIKERDGKIGIFDSEGKLLRIIETYIKSLPEAERTAIEEGYDVYSEKELYSIIEAYED